MAGDTLAQGGKSATFGPAKVSQEKWDAMWSEEPKLPPEKFVCQCYEVTLPQDGTGPQPCKEPAVIQYHKEGLGTFWYCQKHYNDAVAAEVGTVVEPTKMKETVKR